MDIQLNFINRSNDANDTQVVIFQRNVASNFDEAVVAWRVIQHCGVGDNHPFVFAMEFQISCEDAWGNYTPKLDARNGQLFAVALTGSGDTLNVAGPASSPAEIQLRNDLSSGAVSACLYNAGKLLAIKTSLAPQQKAAFAFRPTLWIGVASEAFEGQVLDSGLVSEVNTELSLLGIASADIVMTGGGPGPTAGPFEFSLANVVMA